MNEQDARARMVADITASFSEDMPLPKLMQLHKARGFDAIQIDGEHPTHPVGAEFRRDWEAGVYVGEMGRKYGVTDRTICTWAEKAGYPSRPRGSNPRIKVTPEFRAVWLRGVPTKKIAASLGVAQSTVLRTARIAGLPRRRPGTPHDMFQGAAE
jgi:hypothetical protein